MEHHDGVRRSILATPIAAALVLGIEVVLAQRAPRLPEEPPFDLRRISTDPEAPRVVWLGDSTAAGIGASEPDESLPLQLLRCSGNIDLTVLATSGAKVN